MGFICTSRYWLGVVAELGFVRTSKDWLEELEEFDLIMACITGSQKKKKFGSDSSREKNPFRCLYDVRYSDRGLNRIIKFRSGNIFEVDSASLPVHHNHISLLAEFSCNHLIQVTPRLTAPPPKIKRCASLHWITRYISRNEPTAVRTFTFFYALSMPDYAVFMSPRL